MPSQYLSALHNGATTATPSAGVEVSADVDHVVAEINVTVAGTTASYQVEGSMDNTNWVPVVSLPNDSETAAVSQTYTTTGRRFLAVSFGVGVSRFFRYFRINPTVVTGQTFSTNLYVVDQE